MLSFRDTLSFNFYNFSYVYSLFKFNPINWNWLQDKLLFFYWKMFHPNRLNIFAYKHYLFPYILWIHSCKGWINFQTLLCDSSISLEEKNIRTRIFAAQGDRTTTKFLCKFISGCHGWDIPLLDLEKSRNRVSLSLSFSIFFRRVRSINH